MPQLRKLFSVVMSIIWLSSALVLPAHAADLRLPDFGDSAGAYLSPAEDKRLGQSFMRSVRASSKLESDPLLNDYLQRLGTKLAQHSTSAGGGFDFFLVRDPTINAFAGPGGHIGINTGLVLETETESELAAVVAHEISHVSQHHIARMIESASRMSIPAAGVLLAAILLGAAGAGNAAMAAAVGGQAALVQQQINFTRSNEQEADRVGMQILADSKFDPRAMPVFFQRLGRVNRTSGVTLPEFLRTHPVTTSRISDSLARAESFPYRQASENISYHLTRAALRAGQFSSPTAVVEHFESTLRDGRYRHRDAERYGYALALMKAGRNDEARGEIDALLAKDPKQPEYLVTSARLYTNVGDTASSLSTLQRAMNAQPGSYPVSIISAEAMLNAGRDKEAYDLLRGMLRKYAEDPELHRLQARAAAAIGKSGESHEQLAQYHYGIGEVEAAVQQLEIAAKDSDLDFYARSRIESQLQDLKVEAEELRKESRRK